MNITWDAEAYRRDFSFVPDYGRDVLGLIDAQPGSTCLDLGCGNGALTAELAARGLAVRGVDASRAMVELARQAHPDLRFDVADATDFELEAPVDVVFSNAVLHWIDRDRQPQALACVARALVPGGQFVFECGGFGCCARIHAALTAAFKARGLAYEMPFYFPTIGEYAPLLEAAGLRPDVALLFDRPTRLSGPDGMRDWIHMFVKRPFEGPDPQLAEAIITEAIETLRPDLHHDGTWYADYVRLRMRARRLV